MRQWWWKNGWWFCAMIAAIAFALLVICGVTSAAEPGFTWRLPGSHGGIAALVCEIAAFCALCAALLALIGERPSIRWARNFSLLGMTMILAAALIAMTIAARGGEVSWFD